jgi:prophage regulatory protein
MNIWRIETCKAATGYRSTASIYNNIRDGLWPKAINIGRRSVGWPSDEIIAINAARIAGQTDDQIRDLVKRLHLKRNELIATFSGDQNGA